MKKIHQTLKKFKPNKKVMFLYFFIPIILMVLNTITLDNDIWFILNNGKYVLTNGIPKTDPFTIHNNLELVMQQWLSAVIFYKVYDWSGFVGIIILMFIANLIIIFLSYKLCMLISNKKVYLSVIITITINIFLSMLYLRTRPQIFDYILFLLEFYVLEQYIKKNNVKYLIILPLISLLMINLHATSFLLLFCFILPYIIDSFKINMGFIKGEGYKKKPLIIVTIIMFLIGFINPYGINAITYIFTSLGKGYVNNTIAEMMPLDITNPIGITNFIIIALVIFIYMFAKKGKIKLRYFLLLIGTLYLSFQTVKGGSYFIIASIFPLAEYLSVYFKDYNFKIRYTKKFNIQYNIILIILFISTGMLFIYNSNKYLKEPKDLKKIVNILNQKEKNEMTLYTSYYDGGYMEYKGLIPYIDARAEVFYKSNNKKEDIMKEFCDLQTKDITIEQFIKKYNFTHLVVIEQDVLYEYLKNNKNYKLLYYKKNKNDYNYYLYEKIK